jgi:demethylmenaquinone methyltransferase/2-methoxy-6-polyprenyl-1,4-benzoquinol methylase
MHSPTSTDDVKEMFNRISPTYDLLNALLSGGIHRQWAKKTVLAAPAIPDGECLDLCTGTGALVPALSKRYRKVVAADISPKMLELGVKNYPHITNCEWVEANALSLPFSDERFNVTTVAYGVRNWPNPEKGLQEVFRVTKPGGYISVLEFGQPSNPVWRWVFTQYSKIVIPLLGRIISGDSSAYTYLPETSAKFPCGARFEELLRKTGWSPVTTTSLMGGIAFTYLAKRP